jgi:preprotein translocase subunit YajC
MLNFILLQAAKGAAAPAGDAGASAMGGGMGSLIMIVALIAIFYFFMIRPQNKKQKEIRKFRDAMAKGDKVTTAGGIHGTIKEVRDNGTIILEIADGVKITIDKAMVYPSAQDVVATGADVKR